MQGTQEPRTGSHYLSISVAAAAAAARPDKKKGVDGERGLLLMYTCTCTPHLSINGSCEKVAASRRRLPPLDSLIG